MAGGKSCIHRLCHLMYIVVGEGTSKGADCLTWCKGSYGTQQLYVYVLYSTSEKNMHCIHTLYMQIFQRQTK